MTTCPLVQPLGPTRPEPAPYKKCDNASSYQKRWLFPVVVWFTCFPLLFGSWFQCVAGGVASTPAAEAEHGSHWPGLPFTTLPSNSVLRVWASLHFCNNFFALLSVRITAANTGSRWRWLMIRQKWVTRNRCTKQNLTRTCQFQRQFQMSPNTGQIKKRLSKSGRYDVQLYDSFLTLFLRRPKTVGPPLEAQT